MPRFAWLLTLIVTHLFIHSLWAWNEKGHMIIARLAWKELKDSEREKVIAILERHPHYQDFLKAQKPDGFTEGEWVFLRASTWSDWVRGGSKEQTKYHMSQAHYINLSITAPGYTQAVPGPAQQNVISQLAVSKLMAKNGNQEVRAVHLCWVFHLVGDIHQPLHCSNYFSPRFPKGDLGGNLSQAKIPGRSTIKLHAFWDKLFGTETSVSSIGKGVLEVEELYSENWQQINIEMAKNSRYEDWARESYELAKRYGYLNGKLNPAHTDEKSSDASIPVLPDDYATNAGKVARYVATKAGKRLAGQLREIINEK